MPPRYDRRPTTTEWGHPVPWTAAAATVGAHRPRRGRDLAATGSIAIEPVGPVARIARATDDVSTGDVSLHPATLTTMDGYDAATYGDRFADVYDDWYGTITDTEACVEALARLAAGGPVLELGVGTGRLAVPLAELGLDVTGVDASTAMLARLAPKPGGKGVTSVLGDMADPAADSPAVADRRFGLVFVAYNTLFNLIGAGEQQRCLTNAAALLTEHGCLVVEAFVPDPISAAADAVVPRRVTADRVVLSVSQSDPSRQEVLGQYIDITEAGIKLRPWHIRWATPAQLDALAAAAGLRLAERWAGWDCAPFHAEAPAHVSVYRRAP